MPQIFGNTVVVDKDELIPDFFPSYDALRMKLKRSETRGWGLKRFSYGGHGRKLYVVFDSLDRKIQEAIGDPRAVDHILERYFKIDPEAVDVYTGFKRPNYGYLKEEEQERYITNASVISALLQLKEARIIERLSKGGSIRKSKNVKSLDKSLLDDSITFQDVLAKNDQKHTLPNTLRRFKEVLKAFEGNGYTSVIRDPEGKSFKNATKLNSDVQRLLNNMFGKDEQKPTATKIYGRYESFLGGYIQIVNKETGELYNPKEFKKLSKESIVNFLGSYKSRIGTHASRSHDRQVHIGKTIPHHSFDPTIFSGSLLSIDDRNPPFWYAERKRVWFYNALDVASGAFVCYVSGKTKEGLILEFYRQLVRNYHEWDLQLPDGLECESSLNSSFTDTFLRNGSMFQDVRVERNNARGKVIEREFGELRYDYEKEREGFIPRHTSKSEANQGDLTKPHKIIPYGTIVNDCLLDIETWNNQPHDLNPKITKWDYFKANQHPKLKPTNYKAFLPHLGYHTESSVNAGIVRFRSREFLLGENGEVAVSDKLINLMNQVEGKDIDIYWIDGNDSKIIKALVYLRGTSKLICELVEKPKGSRSKIEQTPEKRAAFKLMSSYVATIIAYQKHQKNQLEAVEIIGTVRKTLNNNFQIKGLNRFEAMDDEPENLGSEGDEFEEVLSNNSGGNNWNRKFKI